MGGSRKTTSSTQEKQQQSSKTTMGSTGAAMSLLPGFQDAAQGALDLGAWGGDVVANPQMQDQYAAQLGSVDRLVADPGAPLDRYTPNVAIQDRYVAGLGDASQQGIQGGVDWLTSAIPWMTQGANDMGQFWGDVARGDYLDPNSNTALQGWLQTFDETAQDRQALEIMGFNDAATAAGAYGDTGFARGRTWMADEFDQNRNATLSNVLMNLYSTEMDRRERATGGLAGALALGTSPFEALDAFGERQRAGEQLEIQDSLARGSEIERQQGNDIQDAEMRRQDEALRQQALLDNDSAMAQWIYAQDQGRIQDSLLREAVRQQIAQGNLTNAQSAHWAQGQGQLDLYNQIFSALANPVFGQTSEGQMEGSSTTTTKQSNPAWANALGALSSIGQTVGGIMTGNPFAAVAPLINGGAGQTIPSVGTPPYVPLQPLPQLPDMSRYFRPSGG